jgi:mono/diheme cytochrome c family protein
MQIAAFAGRFHPLLVHLPIGILLLGVLLALLARRKAFPADWLRFIFLLGALSATLSSLSGLLLAAVGSYEESLLNVHRFSAIGLTVLSWMLWLSSGSGHAATRRLYLPVLVLVPVLLTVTGHLGGSLTHGRDFLTPPPLRLWFAPLEPPPRALKADDRVYDAVAQVFQQKCNSCHGAGRQRGDLRLDRMEDLLRGGNGGQVLIAGNAQGSELMRRMRLPEDDKQHMPPAGRSQVSEAELRLIGWWIEAGASFDLKLAEAAWPDSVASPLEMTPTAGSDLDLAAIPSDPVEAADPVLVDSLVRLGVVVTALAEDIHYLQASFISTPPENYAAALSMLVGLQGQLIGLRMGRKVLGSPELTYIAGLTGLRHLNLEHCLGEGTSLVSLGNLSKLEYLNLTGNPIGMTELEPIGQLAELRSLYLFGTNTNLQDSLQLRRLFPQARLEFGGYSVPTFRTDTTFLDM